MDEIEQLRVIRPDVQPLSDSEFESIWNAIGSSTETSAAPLQDRSRRQRSQRQRRSRRRLVLSGTAAAIFVIAAVGVLIKVTTQTSGDTSRANAPSKSQSPEIAAAGTNDQAAPVFGYVPEGDVGTQFASGAATSCARTATPQELLRRAFAFSGTVMSVSMLDDGRARVTYSVDRWFRGGDAANAVVFTDSPVPSEDTDHLRAGERQLVSGEFIAEDSSTERIAWSCGFTRPWSVSDAQVWGEAFE